MELLDCDPHIVIVGCGAIGSLVAAHLATDGRRVTVLDGWSANVAAIQQGALIIEAPDETHRARVTAHHLDEIGSIALADLLFIAVKAYDTPAALEATAPLRHENTVVVPLQNGMTVDWFGALLDDRSRVVGSAVHVPAELVGPATVRRYLPRNRRTMSLGEPAGGTSPLAGQIAQLLQPVGLCEETSDLRAEKWAKLAVNTMTNAPAGLTGWTTGKLWADPRMVPLVARAAGETLAVAHAAGVEAAPVYGRYEAQLFRDALLDQHTAERVHDAIRQMASERKGASESRPSLLQDVDRGRRTEIEYLNGHVVARGKEFRVPTPVNAALTRLVTDIDRGRLCPGPDNVKRLEQSIAHSLERAIQEG